MAEQRQITKKVIMVQKHDTQANWERTVNKYTPLPGEFVVYDVDGEYNFERMKIGDGSTTIDKLPFANEIPSERQLKFTCGEDAPNNDTEGDVYFQYSANATNQAIMQMTVAEYEAYKARHSLPIKDPSKYTITDIISNLDSRIPQLEAKIEELESTIKKLEKYYKDKEVV